MGHGKTDTHTGASNNNDDDDDDNEVGHKGNKNILFSRSCDNDIEDLPLDL